MLNTNYAMTCSRDITKNNKVNRISFGNDKHIVAGTTLINSGINKISLPKEEIQQRIKGILGCALNEAKQIGKGVVNIPTENPQYRRREFLYINHSNDKRVKIVNVNGRCISVTEDKGEDIVGMKIKGMSVSPHKVDSIEFYDYEKDF